MTIPKYDKKLTDKQRMKMRVDIAKDVIAMLDAKRIVANHGTYIALADEKDGNGYAQHPGEVLKPGRAQLRNKLKNCEVCALGSLFVAEVVKNDKLTTKDFVDAFGSVEYCGDSQTLMRDRLSPFFDKDELRGIEVAFEGHDYCADSDDANADTVLRSIMNVIIDGNGEWNGEKMPNDTVADAKKHVSKTATKKVASRTRARR